MTRKMGLFSVSMMAMVAAGLGAGNAHAADSGIASTSYVDAKVQQEMASVSGLATDVENLQKGMGDLGKLNTAGKESLVQAINEVKDSAAGSDTKVGNLTELNTTAKETAVAAINEVNTKAEEAKSGADKVGDLTGLAETIPEESRGSVVAAVNYVQSEVETANSNIDTLTAATETLETNVETLSGNVGTLTNLETTRQDNLVAAINEVNTAVKNVVVPKIEKKSGTGNVVTVIDSDGGYTVSNVQIPVGGPNGDTYASIWVE